MDRQVFAQLLGGYGVGGVAIVNTMELLVVQVLRSADETARASHQSERCSLFVSPRGAEL